MVIVGLVVQLGNKKGQIIPTWGNFKISGADGDPRSMVCALLTF
jgi:hypothetical protein